MYFHTLTSILCHSKSTGCPGLGIHPSTFDLTNNEAVFTIPPASLISLQLLALPRTKAVCNNSQLLLDDMAFHELRQSVYEYSSCDRPGHAMLASCLLIIVFA